MDYRSITNTSSKQYQIQQEATTNQQGLRVYKDRVLIAIANYNVGDVLDIQLDSGEVIHAIVGDLKANTDCLHGDNSLVEFIVDTQELSPKLVSLGNLNEVYKGNVQKLYRKVG